MRTLLLTLIMLVLTFGYAEAKSHHRHHHHRIAHRSHHHASRYACAGCVVRETLAGSIKVAAAYADRFVGFINDLVNEGYKPKEIGCASSGHMANSKHHWGGACDIDQTDRNRTAAAMYHITALAHAHNLTDGCEWRDKDCGHVEVPTSRKTYVRYAHHHHHIRYASRV